MESHDLKTLLTVDDRLIAEDIQAILEEHEIYTILFSDNSAASIISTYSGLNPIESIDIKTTTLDYQKAIEIILVSPYKELIQ
jgi:hypothetical protein